MKRKHDIVNIISNLEPEPCVNYSIELKNQQNLETRLVWGSAGEVLQLYNSSKH